MGRPQQHRKHLLVTFPANTAKMIIYNDLITGDELISDSYNLKEVDGAVYEADCSKITIGGESVDIGANPSAEEADEGADDSKQQVIDIVHSFRLNETSFDKKSYLSHLKGYMKGQAEDEGQRCRR